MLHEIDHDKDGSVTYAELAQAVKHLKLGNRAHLKERQTRKAISQGQRHGHVQRGRARARDAPSTVKKITRGKMNTTSSANSGELFGPGGHLPNNRLRWQRVDRLLEDELANDEVAEASTIERAAWDVLNRLELDSPNRSRPPSHSNSGSAGDGGGRGADCGDSTPGYLSSPVIDSLVHQVKELGSKEAKLQMTLNDAQTRGRENQALLFEARDREAQLKAQLSEAHAREADQVEAYMDIKKQHMASIQQLTEVSHSKKLLLVACSMQLHHESLLPGTAVGKM